MKTTKKSGFTLVELAIVLVIIGLIIGGVLVGQDLIKAAEIRATATQIEKYNTAATAFRTKYDGYPGDLIQTRALTFGLASAGAGTDGLQDGDGVLENGGTAADKQGVGGEATAFWVHLTQAQFIPDAFTAVAGRNGTIAAAAGTDALVGAVLPTLKIRDSADVHATGVGGRNYFYVAAITAVAVTTGLATEAAALTPVEAESVDQKVDDGAYNTGIFRAYATLANATAETRHPGVAAVAGACVFWGADATDGTADDAYNVANAAFASSVGCRVRWRASF
jgi:prepilin-type N-terminal cleavage/methylation domain-containing protein